MKVKEFLDEINKCGFDDDTELYFYHHNKELGEVFEANIDTISDYDRRKYGDDFNYIEIMLDNPVEYLETEQECFRERLYENIAKAITSTV